MTFPFPQGLGGVVQPPLTAGGGGVTSFRGLRGVVIPPPHDLGGGLTSPDDSR